jgi:DNA transformation protein
MDNKTITCMIKALLVYQEILEPFGPLKIRAMFGGYGIYKDGIIFAIIGYNEVYFKADKVLAKY